MRCFRIASDILMIYIGIIDLVYCHAWMVFFYENGGRLSGVRRKKRDYIVEVVREMWLPDNTHNLRELSIYLRSLYIKKENITR